VVDSCEGELFSFEGLSDQLVRVYYFFVLYVLELLQLHVEPKGIQHLHASASSKSNNFLEERVNFELGRIRDQCEVD
jgi:hypothetical protein